MFLRSIKLFKKTKTHRFITSQESNTIPLEKHKSLHYENTTPSRTQITFISLRKHFIVKPTTCTCLYTRHKQTRQPHPRVYSSTGQNTPQSRDGRFGSKVGQIGPKWDKSGAFSDQISVHLAQGRQMHWNQIWKSPGFVTFRANLTHFGAKPTIPASVDHWLHSACVRQRCQIQTQIYILD